MFLVKNIKPSSIISKLTFANEIALVYNNDYNAIN